jgi:hypothetical protein
VIAHEVTIQHIQSNECSTTNYHPTQTRRTKPRAMEEPKGKTLRIQILDPLTMMLSIKGTQTKARGLMGTNPQKKSSKILKTRRLSSFLFQIGRGSGATLSECIFPSKKMQIT